MHFNSFTEPKEDLYFYHPDHLGSSSFITERHGEAEQHLQYLPFGELFTSQRNHEFDARYKFSAKELDDESGYTYFGARYYDPELSNWLSVDPLAKERLALSPYNYVQWNPLNRVDPTGTIDDWVKNENTGKYEWMDNVTSAKNTPEGYSYVGAEDNDILTDLGLPDKVLYKEQSSMGFGLDGDDRRGAPIGTKTNAAGVVNITPVVNYNLQSEADNNKLGREFKGINIDIALVTESISTKHGLRNNYSGYSTVNIGGKNHSKFLEKPNGNYLVSTGSSLLKSSYFFNSKNTQNNNINCINISAGTTNNNLLKSPKPIKFKWNF